MSSVSSTRNRISSYEGVSAASRWIDEKARWEGIGKTYITQILHNVVELLSFFVLIASLFDSFLTHKVFRNLGPHFVFFRLLSLKPPPSVSGINYGEFARFLRFFTFAAPYTVQLAATACFALKDEIFIVVTTVARATGRVLCQYCSASFRIGSPTCDGFLYAHRVLGKASEALGEEVGFVLAGVVAAPVLAQSLA